MGATCEFPHLFFGAHVDQHPTHHPPPCRLASVDATNSTSHARVHVVRNVTVASPHPELGVLDRTARTDSVYDVDEAHRFDLSVGVRVLVYENSLWLMSRATSFSHTPTPAESPSYPRAQDELVAPSARSGDRGVREWGSSRKARVGTCFFSGARESALSPPGAPGRREGVRGGKPKSAPLGAAHLSQARPRQPSHPARKISLSLKRVSGSVHKLRHRTFPQRSGLSHHWSSTRNSESVR